MRWVCSLAVFSLSICALAGCQQQPRQATSATENASADPEPIPPLPPYQAKAGLRRPVDLLVTGPRGRWLLSANQRAGTISVIDTTSWSAVAETPVGKRLSGLKTASADDGVLLAADEEGNQLVALKRRGAMLEVVERLALPKSPVGIAVTDDHQRAFVACLWAHLIVEIDLTSPRMEIARKIELPYAPRALQMLGDGKHLVAADAFGGRFGLIDAAGGTLVKTRDFNAHNMHGITLTADGKNLLVAHQALMSDSPTSLNNVHWGAVMMNLLRTVSVESLFREPPPIGAMLDYLGDQDNATGDPTSILVAGSGRRIVSLAGVSEVGLSDTFGANYASIKVGRRPTALALSPDESLLYVANTHDDSISVIDMSTSQPIETISLGPAVEPTLADRGEILFHAASLSKDGWFSCHSCHTDGHSNGLLNDNFGDGSVGAPKRVLSLREVAHTSPYAWNGGVKDLKSQIRKSILTTMRGEARSDEDIDALAEYLKSLRAPPSLSDARGELNEEQVAAGKKVFGRMQCADCHEGAHFTSTAAHDVGLQDKHGNREFNPPTLLGVSQRRYLMHDNRAKSLREVFTTHGHGLEKPLEKNELEALLAYLNRL